MPAAVPRLQSPVVRAPTTTPDDPRLGQLLLRRLPAATTPRVVLIGFPSDRGVRQNHGRPGAAAAPTAIRRALYALTPGSPSLEKLAARTHDAGDVVLTTTLQRDQDALAKTVAHWLDRGVIPVIIGGGHETAFGHFLAYATTGRDVAILNVDAHVDVRELVRGRGHSGSMFRQALLHRSGACRGYTVAGLLPHAVAAAHLAFVQAHRGSVIWRDALTARRARTLMRGISEPTLVTFDVDALDASVAPGVSAPAAGGLDLQTWLAAAHEAGRNPHVGSIDIAEVNPRFDVDGRTARVAALTIWTFLKGLTERPR